MKNIIKVLVNQQQQAKKYLEEQTSSKQSTEKIKKLSWLRHVQQNCLAQQYEREKFKRELAKISVSLIKLPKEEERLSPSFKEVIMISESRMIEYRLQEQIRLTLLAASDSNITTEGGKGIFSDKAAIISPLDFRITPPIPASFEFSKTAPSKFVLKESKGGGDHFFLAFTG